MNPTKGEKMILRTGRKCGWNEIEVGEVFAWNKCWVVMIKINNNKAFELDCDENFRSEGEITTFRSKLWNSYYKLPRSVQNLWAER